MKGRPKMDPGKARSVTLRARVRPGAAVAFRAKATSHGLTESEALREAMAMWMKGRK